MREADFISTAEARRRGERMRRSASGRLGSSMPWNDETQLVTNFVAGAWRSEFAYDGLMRRRVRKEYTWTGSALPTSRSWHSNQAHAA